MNPELMDIMAGRHCCECINWEFPHEGKTIRMNAFATEGRVIWETWIHKHFWSEVAKGSIGLNPQWLFRGLVN